MGKCAPPFESHESIQICFPRKWFYMEMQFDPNHIQLLNLSELIACCKLLVKVRYPSDKLLDFILNVMSCFSYMFCTIQSTIHTYPEQLTLESDFNFKSPISNKIRFYKGYFVLYKA